MSDWILAVGYMLLVVWTVYRTEKIYSELRFILPDLRRIGMLQAESPLAIMRNGLREMVDLIIFMSNGGGDEEKRNTMQKDVDEIPDMGSALVHMHELRKRLINETVQLRLRSGGLGNAPSGRVGGASEA